MRDLTTVLQDLYHREINCRIESFWDCGFRIVLGDRLNGELAALTVPVEELPGAGERLWSLALQHHPVIAAPPVEEAAVAEVLPLSRVIAQAVPETVFPVAEIADPAAEADVLCYTVLPDNQHFETIWYINARGEVREEVAPLRDPWRQSARFRNADEKAPDEFRRLYIDQ